MRDEINTFKINEGFIFLWREYAYILPNYNIYLKYFLNKNNIFFEKINTFYKISINNTIIFDKQKITQEDNYYIKKKIISLLFPDLINYYNDNLIFCSFLRNNELIKYTILSIDYIQNNTQIKAFFTREHAILALWSIVSILNIKKIRDKTIPYSLELNKQLVDISSSIFDTITLLKTENELLINIDNNIKYISYPILNDKDDIRIIKWE
jgi:hypothetical protein